MFKISIERNIWSPRRFSFNKGTFKRAKYVNHSTWISITILHREFGITLHWKNANPNARY